MTLAFCGVMPKRPVPRYRTQHGWLPPEHCEILPSMFTKSARVSPDVDTEDAARPHIHFGVHDTAQVVGMHHSCRCSGLVNASVRADGSVDKAFETRSSFGSNEARDLVERARRPMPLGNITGAWRVASIQLGTKGGYAYPYFAAHIERTACGYRFIKTRGSQRRGGALLPMPDNDRALAFLGVLTLNRNTSQHYGLDNTFLGQLGESREPINSDGSLLRVAPDTLLMILDANDKRVRALSIQALRTSNQVR